MVGQTQTLACHSCTDQARGCGPRVEGGEVVRVLGGGSGSNVESHSAGFFKVSSLQSLPRQISNTRRGDGWMEGWRDGKQWLYILE